MERITYIECRFVSRGISTQPNGFRWSDISFRSTRYPVFRRVGNASKQKKDAGQKELKKQWATGTVFESQHLTPIRSEV
jgi:hypothetical protein